MIVKSNVEPRVAVITGSSRGLGFAIASEFLADNYAVFLSGLVSEELEQARSKLALVSGPDRVGALAGDIGDPQFSGQLIAAAISCFGNVDTLVCNAGVDIIKPAIDYTPEEWDLILNVNLRGAFFAAQAAARYWVAAPRRGASIAMTSSIAGAVGVEELAPYAASKGGMNQLVRTLALEWARHGIRVNAVAPGYLENIMAGAVTHDDPATQERVRRDTPIGRKARLAEVAAAFVFLSSDAASYITGTVLPVDGGYTAR